MSSAPTHRSRLRWRLIKLGYLALATAVIAILAFELVLTLHVRRAREIDARFRNRDVHASQTLASGSGKTLWKRPWREYRPGRSARKMLGGQLYDVRINSHGFRTQEFERERPEATLRVVCIGGSTTVMGRTGDTTYPARLQATLADAFPGWTVEVLNLGVSGTRSDFWLERPGRLFRYQPHVVVQMNAVNDILGYHLPAYAEENPNRSRLYRSLAAEWLLFDADEIEPYLRETLENFARMREACRRRGVAYVVGSFAAPDAARADRNRRLYLDASTERYSLLGLALKRVRTVLPLRFYRSYAKLIARHNRLLERFAAEHGIALAEVHRVTDPTWFTDICHMNDDGIDALAAAFAPRVRAELARIVREQAPAPEG